MKIMFSGASGTGKTTLAQHVSQNWELPFKSGSVSDLLPNTKDMPHKDMLARNGDDLVMEDYQILNLRNKLFSSNNEFVTDRSLLDSAAYFLYKQADKLPQCEVEQFLDLCLMSLSRNCSHLIFIPFTLTMYRDWVIEDNKKRITSRYFQMEISRIMEMILDIWRYKRKYESHTLQRCILSMPKELEDGYESGIISNTYGETRVLILKEAKLNNRMDIINLWLKKNS